MLLVSCDGDFHSIHFNDEHDSTGSISSFQVTSSDSVSPIESLQTSPMHMIPSNCTMMRSFYSHHKLQSGKLHDRKSCRHAK